MPAISFVIPTYNYGRHIRPAIESILSVKRDYDEIIIVDDGSTDETRDVLSGWIADNMIHYIYQENAGVSAARNAGAQYASKDYLYFLDSDDCIIKNGFKRLREAIESQPDKALIFGGHRSREVSRVRSHSQKSVGIENVNNFTDYVIKRKFSIANGSALIKRNIALRYPYPEDLKVSEDFCVYAWVLANEPVSSIPDVVVEIKKHDDSLRNQANHYADVVERLPDVLFSLDYLPNELMRFRRQFYCRRLLSLFRSYYNAGDKIAARQTYHKAIRCNPLNLFKLSYLRKCFRMFLT